MTDTAQPDAASASTTPNTTSPANTNLGPRPLLITKDSPYAEFAFFDENAMHKAEEKHFEAPLQDIVSVHSLPDMAYLRHTIIPLLVPALQETAKARPKDPLQFLAAYLVSNNPQRDVNLPTPGPEYAVLMGRVPLQSQRPMTPQVPPTPMVAEQPAAATPGKGRK